MTAIPTTTHPADTSGRFGAGKYPRYNRVMGTWAVIGARVAGTLAVLALIGAWIATLRGGTFLGFTEQHLFNDAIVLSLFSIAGLLDGLVHRQAA
jgi:hypothetical protein